MTQNWSIWAKFAKKNPAKSAVFYWLFLSKVSIRNFLWNWSIFARICPWESREILLFFLRNIRSPVSKKNRTKRNSGCQIMAGRWTMSGQNWALPQDKSLDFQTCCPVIYSFQKKFSKEILTLNYLIVTRDNIHVSERKTNIDILHKPRQFYLVVEKFPVVANFHWQ